MCTQCVLKTWFRFINEDYIVISNEFFFKYNLSITVIVTLHFLNDLIVTNNDKGKNKRVTISNNKNDRS